MKIACFGDSLTFGSVGYSYIRLINSEHKVINKGINGDTTVGLYKRLKRYIESPRSSNIDTYVIAIGTNDLLLPYLSTVSSLWKIQMIPRVKIKNCLTDDNLFMMEYRKVIELILSHNKAVIAVGLPLLQLKDYPNKRVIKRNSILKNIATEAGASFIDTANLQQNVVPHMTISYSWKHGNIVRIFDGIIMFVFPFSKNWFSTFRHLELTVDGVHFNSRAAKLVGDAINASVKQKQDI